MLVFTPRCLMLAAAILLALGTDGPLAWSADSQPAQKLLSKEDRAEVTSLLKKYRAASSDLEKKQEICAKVLGFGPAAAPLMLTAVERDFQPELRKYSTKFQALAAAAASQKAGKVDLHKVMEMRATVQNLEKLDEGLTKNVIVEKIDPIMQELKAAFILDRSEVLDKSPDLKAERKKLQGYAEMRERCNALITTLPVKQVAKKGGQKKATAVQATPENGTAEDKPHDKAPSASFDSTLQAEEELAALMAILDPRTRAILAMDARLAENIDPEEARAILELNISRILLGLPALAIDLRLCEAAREHSQDMERLNFFAHESPVPGKKTFGDRAKLVGTTASAENIAAGPKSGKGAHEGWFHSPGHHRNQMGDAARVGVGRSGKLFTQMFGK